MGVGAGLTEQACASVRVRVHTCLRGTDTRREGMCDSTGERRQLTEEAV